MSPLPSPAPFSRSLVDSSLVDSSLEQAGDLLWGLEQEPLEQEYESNDYDMSRIEYNTVYQTGSFFQVVPRMSQAQRSQAQLIQMLLNQGPDTESDSGTELELESDTESESGSE